MTDKEITYDTKYDTQCESRTTNSEHANWVQYFNTSQQCQLLPVMLVV